MLDKALRLRRRLKAVHRRARELKMICRGLASTGHPVMAHIIATRRCNLSCAYCNEYDDSSKSVPTETMLRRVDMLASLGTTVVTISGGELRRLGEEERRVYLEIKRLEKRSYSQINYFQYAIAHGQPGNWRCRVGARYLYICEDGLVHYCSQQRGYPAKPLAEYTKSDIRREFLTEKSCAPYCTVSCVHQISYIDFWRAPQTIRPSASLNSVLGEAQLVHIESSSQ